MIHWPQIKRMCLVKTDNIGTGIMAFLEQLFRNNRDRTLLLNITPDTKTTLLDISILGNDERLKQVIQKSIDSLKTTE
ncbi:hypothetical protein KJ693_07685 [bacterium]|nr:hypothetical protein [bacterium]MBU1615179.1 hypothetical protein [bacterium]